MRNISFSMTTEQVRRREKTVTRRLGWSDLKPGTILQAVEKAQGLKKGEHVKPICLIRVVSVKREMLCLIQDYGWAELAREGFPDLTDFEFCEMFKRANHCLLSDPVNRIEFEYVPCHAGSDGDCSWPECPQTRDGEPAKSGRACPLPWRSDE